MSEIILTKSAGGMSSSPVDKSNKLQIDISSVEPGDAHAFRAALDRHIAAGSAPHVSGPSRPGGKPSMADIIATRTTDLASEVKKDQQYVSKMLEQATRTGDSMQLMHAMMALNDYQLKVQVISKTVSKASTSVDSLTKLQ